MAFEKVPPDQSREVGIATAIRTFSRWNHSLYAGISPLHATTMSGSGPIIIIGMMLETERLVLETWQASDWAEFRPIATDHEVMRYITGGVPWSDDQIRSFVDRQVRCY